MTEPRRIKTIRTKIVGVTFDNPDGRSRQRIIRRCKAGEDLYLDWELDNQFDKDATAVRRRKNDQQLGYLSRDLAPQIVSYQQRGFQFSVEIINLTGGTRSETTLGANIEIGVFEPQD